MLKLFYPDIYVNSLVDIPVERLREKHITSYIMDLDNTVTEWNSNHLTDEVTEWVRALKEGGCKACIVSNNKEKRVAAVAGALEIPYVCRAGKPFRRAFRRALTQLGAAHNETAVVGDQIFTDILGGNLMGMVTILVNPINKREFLGTRVMSRNLEKLILGRIKANMRDNAL